MTVEERLSVLEKELAQLKQTVAPAKQDWIADISGSFKGDPEFGEVLRLGREIRDAEKLDDAERSISMSPWSASMRNFSDGTRILPRQRNSKELSRPMTSSYKS